MRGRLRPLASLGLALTIGLAIDLAPRPGRAAEVRAQTKTLGEGYMVRVPGSADLLSRRRLVQYVNLGVYELLPPRRPGELHRSLEEGQLHIVSSMRLRNDFGTYLRQGDDRSARTLESLDGRQVDLLFAYLEGQRLGGFVDLRAGRQFEMSGLDFYAFDGAWTRAHLPVLPLAVEAFGGMMVDGSQLFGFPTFELDGTNGTARDRSFSPMAGAALSSSGLRWLDARLAYRRTFTPSALNRGAIDDDGSAGLASGVDQELVSLSAAARLADGRLSPYAALRYNLGTARLDDVSAGIHMAMSERQSIRALYIRTIPAFDLDSIFNTFTNEAFEDVRVVLESRPNARWILAARSQTRLFRDQTTSELETLPARALRLGVGGGVTASYRIRRLGLRMDGYGLGGEGGVRAGGSLESRTMVAWNRLAIDGRIYGVYYRDDQSEARRGYSLAVQGGLNVQLWRGIHLNLLGEELMTNYYTSALRILASLSADWTMRAGRRR
ncbi:MAG: hypothetical protein KC420_07790 [Myxococcales bacterium]|nr:hypothetical protein [Myxococcales bacterium]MCB9566564.1 hypothetical protein [Myxococcales bacterium]MCB9705587.1 hypothetical protein [Myxococcales bacterium]